MLPFITRIAHVLPANDMQAQKSFRCWTLAQQAPELHYRHANQLDVPTSWSFDVPTRDM